MANGTTTTTTRSVQDRYAAVLVAKTAFDHANETLKAAVKDFASDQAEGTIRILTGPDGQKTGFVKFNGRVQEFKVEFLS